MSRSGGRVPLLATGKESHEAETASEERQGRWYGGRRYKRIRGTADLDVCALEGIVVKSEDRAEDVGPREKITARAGDRERI